MKPEVYLHCKVLTALQIYVLKNQIMLFASYLLPRMKKKQQMNNCIGNS